MAEPASQTERHVNEAPREVSRLRALLDLQDLDIRLSSWSARERQIPKQKEKFEIQRQRLEAELEEREKLVKDLLLEQRECEGEIEQRQSQIEKYQQQLHAVKKNEEYTALLHEIDQVKKQIGVKEERILNIMMEMDEAKARLEEDRSRIQQEEEALDKECALIDQELAEARQERERLESEREPLAKRVDDDLLSRYERIRQSGHGTSALVPLNDEVCGGCHMHVRAQIVNEVLAGDKIHTCQHCGRLLYHPQHFDDSDSEA